MKSTVSVLTALAAFASFGAIRSVTPTAWNGDPGCWQMKRHHEKMSTVTNGGAKIVFVGDSITHFWESRGKEQLAKYFSQGELKMLDLGTSADRTEHVLWRLTEGGELDGYEAKAVFVMIGTNNTGHFPFEKEPPADTILGIREILRVIRAKQPTAKVVLTAIFPRGADATDARRRRNAIVNKEIAKFADGKNVFWLDFSDQLLTVDGRLSREIFPDLLHPAAYGYEVWASAVLPYAQAALAGSPMPPSRYASVISPEGFAIDGPLSVIPAARSSEAWWLDRLLEKRNQIVASDGTFDLVFFGDSITHNWDRKVPEMEEELRKTYTLLNLGYSGDKTENLLWRGLNGELDGYKAKCVMLLIGTNNTWHRSDRPADIASGVKSVLDVISLKQPQAKILLLPIFPFGDGPAHKNRVNNEAANAMIKGLADGEKVIFVDFNAKFLDEKGDTVAWMPDRCHPKPEAYREIWLPAVMPYFRQIVGK